MDYVTTEHVAEWLAGSWVVGILFGFGTCAGASIGMQLLRLVRAWVRSFHP
ncbi:MAG: hypothetical protein BIFFINMI_00387 [Phycisphaerae bacterium]|nr:hypothetical protein [Phycisphaerae bacterium]